MRRDDWTFVLRLALCGCVFPLVWALIPPVVCDILSE
jgi:hypothetical protein